MESEISRYVGGLYADRKAHEYSCDLISSTVHQINAPIPVELYSDLQAMSRSFRRDINCLAGDLLSMAVKEAVDSLPKNEQHMLKKIQVALEKKEIKQHLDEQQYDAGAP